MAKNGIISDRVWYISYVRNWYNLFYHLQLTSGYSQGAMAGRLALRVLAGEQPAHIPAVKDNVNRTMFDERQMKRYGIDRSQLPEGSTIINESYTAKKQVLVLQSYHSDMPWVHNVV